MIMTITILKILKIPNYNYQQQSDKISLIFKQTSSHSYAHQKKKSSINKFQYIKNRT